MKFNYLTIGEDGKDTGAVSADYVASRLANRTIGVISIADSGMGLGFSLSDGGKIKFRLKQDGAEVIYSAPSKK